MCDLCILTAMLKNYMYMLETVRQETFQWQILTPIFQAPFLLFRVLSSSHRLHTPIDYNQIA